jgi:hypothetical protein
VDSTPDINFALIGPGKSGTTALFNALRRHPEVRLARVKETCFFNDHFHRGVDWYHALFPPDGGQPHVGEVSNTYVFSPAAAARMAAYNPRMRVVTCLRNPVDRAFSHWLFLERNGARFGTLEQALAARQDLIDRGMYAKHLAPWLQAFPRDQVLILLFDDFKTDALGTYNRLLSFLGASAVAELDLADGDWLAASAPRFRALSRIVKRGASLARQAGLPGIIQRVKDGPLPRLLYRRFSEADRPSMTDGQRRALAANFIHDASQLSGIVGRDMVAAWRLGA